MSSSSSEEFQLPTAVVQRIVKAALPEGAQVAKDAKSAIGVAGKVFINYLTACANDICMNSNRSTISSNDVLGAIEELEFPEMVPVLKEFLVVAKNELAVKMQEKKAASADTNTASTTKEDEDEQDVDKDNKDQEKEKEKEKPKPKTTPKKSKGKGKAAAKSKSKAKGTPKGKGKGKEKEEGDKKEETEEKGKEESIDESELKEDDTA